MADTLPEGWQTAFDSARGHHYYFNLALGKSQWTHPGLDAEGNAAEGATGPPSTSDAETVPSTAAQPTQGESSTQASEDKGGWYYRDFFGLTQGPFTQEQLQSWRGQLPMDLLVWFTEPSSAEGEQEPGVGPSSEDDMPAIELAELIGDGHLLADWRSKCPVQDQTQAPPATVWQQWLASEGAEQDASGSGISYAEAALAGLPAHDEAVIISQLASAAGKTLEDVMDFIYNAAQRQPQAPPTINLDEPEAPPPEPEDPSGAVVPPPTYDYSNYEFTAIKDKMRGKIKTVLPGDQGPGGAATLYQELKNWCDPVELEKALQAMSARKGMKVPPNVWKKLKERKLQMKKKLRAQWMQV